MSTIRTLDRWGWIFAIFGAASVANALWMLAGPLHWYHEVPAAVPDTGPFNPHFVFKCVKTYTNVMNHKAIRL